MRYTIHKAAVLGDSIEGAEIAAHLANAGIQCFLLASLPPALSKEEKSKGWTETDKKWRNKIADSALLNLRKEKPYPFYTKKYISRIQTGNFGDHLKWLSEVDWVIEMSAGSTQSKSKLLAQIEPYLRTNCILSSGNIVNGVNNLSGDLPLSLRERFLGTHFFRPIRTTPLLELTPIKETRRDILSFMTRFGERVLGKNVIICMDTPVFTNNIGLFDLCNAMHTAINKHFSIAQMDEIGRAIGRPELAFFGTLDNKGIDSTLQQIESIYVKINRDNQHDRFILPAFFDEMIERKLLGEKTRKGFYMEAGGVKHYLDYNTMEYIPINEGNPIFLKIVEGTNGSIVTMLNTLFTESSILGEAVREFLCRYFLFAANNIPETCTDIETLDKAIKWGCGHALGPFETWDAVGVRAAVEIMKNYKWDIPAKIEEMLSKGHETFYKRTANGLLRFDLDRKEYVPAAGIPEEIDILSIRKKSIIVRKNQTASLNDVGDGIAYLEFNTNTLNYDTLQFIMECCDEVERNFVGLLIGSHGVNFSAGIDVGTIIVGIYNMDWNSIEELVVKFQNMNMRLKYLEKPVVAMPKGLTVMGGCELAMHSAACQPRAETMMGFQETHIGLIPLGGGCKEQMVRLTENLPDGVLERGMNIQQLYLKVLENLTSSKVSSSAAEAVELGYLRRNDPISLNPDRQFWEAKQLVLGLAKYYRCPQPSMIPVMGESFRGLVESNLLNLRMGRFVSEYDSQIARKIACVISGGECPSGTIVKEEEILALEREAILSLCGERNTQERLIHFLKTGKPLGN